MQRSTLRRRSTLAGAAFLLGASLLAVSAAPSGADAEIQGCWRPGRWVVFQDINNNWWGTSGGNMNCWSPGTKTNMPSNMNDQVSSIENNTDQTVCFYQHADQQGASIQLVPGSYILDLTAYSLGGGTWNDQISSIGPC
jgi:hypothetical protein